ncbi:MAG: tRNA (pseudouridine(54)-N(1))-methyltransferase TrmY [Candidatus Thermoplasmatota archaeon]
MRRFLVVGHKAASAPGFSHKDLSGSGGRIDVLARCLPAAFLVSHGLRPGVELLTLHLGPPAAPKAVRVRSATLKHLNPDERTTALLLDKALSMPTTGPVWQESTPGVSVAVLSFKELLDVVPPSGLFLMDEGGDDISKVDVPADATFVLGDHLGFTPDELTELDRRGARHVCLGPVSLQADQCIVVLHNHLDRR